MWETVEAFRAAHPDFQLEDELFVEGGGERCYGRQRLSKEGEAKWLGGPRAAGEMYSPAS
jgi:hypothetical protein